MITFILRIKYINAQNKKINNRNHHLYIFFIDIDSIIGIRRRCKIYLYSYSCHITNF